MALPSSANLPNYPAFANARTYDAEFDRMIAQCMAYGEGIAPFDQSKDCTITSMGANKATDLEVTTNSSGLQLSVALGNAWVKGDTRTTQGLYFCHVPTANIVTLEAAHATHPRIDAVILQVADADAAGGSTNWSVTYAKGTATAGATLTNLTGAPTIPDSALILAYVLVPATFAGPFVNATHIQDRRFFAYRPGRVIGRVENTSGVTIGSLSNSTYSSVLISGGLTVTGNASYVVDLDVECGADIYSTSGAHVLQEIVSDGAPGATIVGVKQHHATAANIRSTSPKWSPIAGAISGQKNYNLSVFNATGGAIQVTIENSATAPIYMLARYR